MKKIIMFLCLAVLLSGSLSVSAFLQSDLNYCINDEGRKVYTSKTYEQTSVISYINDGEMAGFSQPEDLFIDCKNELYIADTGNNRIVRLTKDGEIIKIYKSDEDPLYQPTGVFVDENGDIYIADAGKQRIVILDTQGKLKNIIGRPASDLLNNIHDFVPTKVALGTTGHIYTIVGKDFMAIDLNGNFKGFVGAERLGFSLKRLLINLFASDVQKGKIAKDMPSSYLNFTVDSEGKIVACSSANSSQIKVLDYLGQNIYPMDFYGEKIVYNKYYTQYPVFNDICVDEDGTVTLVEQRSGKVFQYDKDGKSITIFGGLGTTRGFFQAPVAIENDDMGNLYILDKIMNNIQVFTPTEFLNTITRANRFYFAGDYESSLQEWQKIVKINADYPLASARIGNIYYKNEQYDLSLENYYNGDNMTGYSETFSELRRLFIRDHLGVVILGGIFLFVGLVISFKKVKSHVKKAIDFFYFGE